MWSKLSWCAVFMFFTNFSIFTIFTGLAGQPPDNATGNVAGGAIATCILGTITFILFVLYILKRKNSTKSKMVKGHLIHGFIFVTYTLEFLLFYCLSLPIYIPGSMPLILVYAVFAAASFGLYGKDKGIYMDVNEFLKGNNEDWLGSAIQKDREQKKQIRRQEEIARAQEDADDERRKALVMQREQMLDRMAEEALRPLVNSLQLEELIAAAHSKLLKFDPDKWSSGWFQYFKGDIHSKYTIGQIVHHPRRYTTSRESLGHPAFNTGMTISLVENLSGIEIMFWYEDSYPAGNNNKAWTELVTPDNHAELIDHLKISIIEVVVRSSRKHD